MDSLSLTSLNFYVGIDSEQLARQRFANYLYKNLPLTTSNSESFKGSTCVKRSLSTAYIKDAKELRQNMAEVVSGIGKSTAADDAGCLEEPDMTMIINSLSKAIHEQIVLTQTKGDTAGSGIFDETEHPIMSMLIVSIFISRLIVRIGLRIHNHTWKRIVIGTSIVVSKVWIDIPVHNSDFKLVLPALAADGLLKLERELGLMAYNVSVSREDYACHYYCIRSSDDNTGAVLTCVKEFVNTTGPSPTSCASKHEHLPILDSGENLAHLNPTLTWDGIVPDVVFGKSCTRSSETLPKWTSLTSSE